MSFVDSAERAEDLGGDRAHEVPSMLRPWSGLGLVISADIHVARRLTRLGGETDDLVLLGAALVVRALRLGHVCVDLSTVSTTASSESASEAELAALPWPDPGQWRNHLVGSALVADGDGSVEQRPLRLVGNRLYLDRYWRQERQVAADIAARSAQRTPVDPDTLAEGLDRLWPMATDSSNEYQRRAATTVLGRRFSVIAGGPGTGKTTMIARTLALLIEQALAEGHDPPRVALVAPTGKAAARLEEAVRTEASRLPVSPVVRAWLEQLTASTLHRLLGRRPDSATRFRHDRRQRLTHDTVIIDETSMVSLSLMASLLDAVRPDARLVLVGDPEQLSSVEAGAVLGDVVGNSGRTEAAITPSTPWAADLAEGIVFLRRVHRFGGGIAELASAIQAGDADAALELVTSGRQDLALVELDALEARGRDVAGPTASAPSRTAPSRTAPSATGYTSSLAPLRAILVDTFRAVTELASEGDGAAALERLGAVRVLCAHRAGPTGVATWNQQIEAWLNEAVRGVGGTAVGGVRGVGGTDGLAADGPWYLGRPLLVTANDYELRLFNGDTGVIALHNGQPAAAFLRNGMISWTSPSRLSSVQTVYSMTIHKSQGSQFDEVIVILPDPSSPVLTRQLLYTAITRARRAVTLVGSADALQAGVRRPIARASGLAERLWGPATGSLQI